jgi:hypothetical protein
MQEPDCIVDKPDPPWHHSKALSNITIDLHTLQSPCTTITPSQFTIKHNSLTHIMLHPPTSTITLKCKQNPTKPQTLATLKSSAFAVALHRIQFSHPDLTTTAHNTLVQLSTLLPSYKILSHQATTHL